MGRSSHARTRSRQPGRWWSQSLKRTIGLVPTSARAGGRRRLTRSSLRMAVGTIPNPRMHLDDENADAHRVWAQADRSGPARRANLIYFLHAPKQILHFWSKAFRTSPVDQSIVCPSATDGATRALNNSYAPIKNMHAALARITGTRAATGSYPGRRPKGSASIALLTKCRCG